MYSRRALCLGRSNIITHEKILLKGQGRRYRNIKPLQLIENATVLTRTKRTWPGPHQFWSLHSLLPCWIHFKVLLFLFKLEKTYISDMFQHFTPIRFQDTADKSCCKSGDATFSTHFSFWINLQKTWKCSYLQFRISLNCAQIHSPSLFPLF